MSIDAVLLGARDVLRAAFTNILIVDPVWEAESIDIQPGPRPDPFCGQKFIALYGTSWQPEQLDQNQGLDEVFGIAAAISFRAGYVPDDRQGTELYVKLGSGLCQIARLVNAKLHQSYEAMGVMNAYLTTPNEIVEPLRWLGTDPSPREVDDIWFGVDPENARDNFVAGLVLETRLGMARRLQTLPNME